GDCALPCPAQELCRDRPCAGRADGHGDDLAASRAQGIEDQAGGALLMSMSHLTDTQLQGLADGTLRGPEGMAAREHCEGCSACDAELSLYTALAGRLSLLQDPLPPADFT